MSQRHYGLGSGTYRAIRIPCVDTDVPRIFSIFVTEDNSWLASEWVVLVRPDGHISMVERLESASAQKICTFLGQL